MYASAASAQTGMTTPVSYTHLLCVITCHSLEDRLVKQRFRQWATACTCPPEYPVCVCGGKAKGKLVFKKPVEASQAEQEANRRARSAKLRVIEKL